MGAAAGVDSVACIRLSGVYRGSGEEIVGETHVDRAIALIAAPIVARNVTVMAARSARTPTVRIRSSSDHSALRELSHQHVDNARQKTEQLRKNHTRLGPTSSAVSPVLPRVSGKRGFTVLYLYRMLDMFVNAIDT
jgi:hypothetical protein